MIKEETQYPNVRTRRSEPVTAAHVMAMAARGQGSFQSRTVLWCGKRMAPAESYCQSVSNGFTIAASWYSRMSFSVPPSGHHHGQSYTMPFYSGIVKEAESLLSTRRRISCLKKILGD